MVEASFDDFLGNLELVFKRCKETNLVLNWEKFHFMVKKRIVLGHRVFDNGIKVDRIKIEAIEKFTPSTSMTGIRSSLGHEGFIRGSLKNFQQQQNLFQAY